jgi:hypothetical protein
MRNTRIRGSMDVKSSEKDKANQQANRIVEYLVEAGHARYGGVSYREVIFRGESRVEPTGHAADRDHVHPGKEAEPLDVTGEGIASFVRTSPLSVEPHDSG